MSEPLNWRDIVRADVEGLPESKPSVSEGSAQLQAEIRKPIYALLVERAAERRISVPTYVRRATMAMLAHELGIPFGEFTAIDPRVTRDTGYPVQDPGGDAFGKWEIAALAGGDDE